MSQYIARPGTLKDLQNELLSLLKIVDKICKKNNIEYWLDAGTLLGAVRHQGFIPWDDDIDISVPAGDYHRLLSALDAESEANKDIFLYSEHNNVPRFTPERLASTKMIILRGKKKFACFIDIFPARIINKTNRENDRSISNTAEYFVFGSALNNKKINSKYVKNSLKKAFEEKQKFTEYFHFNYLPSCNHRTSDSLIATIATTSNDAICGTEAYFPYKDIFPLQNINFEGVDAFAPNNFDKYLKKVYGDYMVLPPKSKQIAKHANDIYFCSSRQFALDATSKSLTSNAKSFYRNPVQRLLKKIIQKSGVYKNIKNWDKTRRIRKYNKKT